MWPTTSNWTLQVQSSLPNPLLRWSSNLPSQLAVLSQPLSLLLLRMVIPNSAVPDAYTLAKQVYDGTLTLTNAATQLVNKHGLNVNSARDYINNFRYLMEGRGFQRTLNAFSMEYYFERFSTEYKPTRLAKALTALREHILYYQNYQLTRQGRAVTMKEMWRIYYHYSSLLPDTIQDQIEQDELEAIAIHSQTKADIIQALLQLRYSDSQIVTIHQQQYKRDNLTVAQLKILRDHQCQICQTTIRKENGGYYIEGAHITAKSRQGRETPDNILILCPNHHKEFDYGDVRVLQRDKHQVVFSMNGTTHTISLRIA